MELIERGGMISAGGKNRLKHVIELKAADPTLPHITIEKQDIPLKNVQGHVELRLVGGG